MAKNNKKEFTSNNNIEKTEKQLLKDITGISDYKEDNKDIESFEKALENFFDSHKPLKNKNFIDMLTVNTLNKDSRNGIKQNREINSRKKNAMKVLEEQNDWDSIFKLEAERCDKYSDYKIIYDYIPELRSCIDGYTDSVISPDDISGTDINILYKGKPISDNEILMTDTKLSDLEDKIEKLKVKYDLTNYQRNLILHTYIYGDQFNNIERIDDSFTNILLREQNNQYLAPNMKEKNKDLLLENNEIKESDLYSDDELEVLKESVNNMGFLNLEKETKSKRDEKIEDYTSKITKNVTEIINSINILGSEGLYDKTIGKARSKNCETISDKVNKLNFNGSVIKNLDPKFMVKLEMDGVNFGYIYAHKKNISDNLRKTQAGNFFEKDFFRSGVMNYNDTKDREELLTNILTKGISKKINLDFLEDNADFKEFILVLMQNKMLFSNKLDFVFFPADKVVHTAIDKSGIYGTSRLANSLFFAKLYLATLMNDMMQKLTRGRDKRVIYVEVGIDEAIEEAIQEVVRNIRSKEVQSDVLKNITTIFKQVGMFEDYVIPIVDGEHNVDFDTISGMDVSVDDDWNQFLLKSIIKGTGYPPNYVDSYAEVDFARTVVMQNTFLCKKIISDQNQFSVSLTETVRKLFINEYKGDYDEGEIESIANDLKVVFPKPVSLNISNVNEQINNASQEIDFIMADYFPDDQNTGMEDEDVQETKRKTEVKKEFKKRITRDILPSINWDKYDEILRDCEIYVNGENLKSDAQKTEDEIANENMSGQSDGNDEDLDGVDF